MKVTFDPEKQQPPRSAAQGFDGVMFEPGVNEVSEEAWEQIKENTEVQAAIEQGALVMGGSEEAETPNPDSSTEAEVPPAKVPEIEPESAPEAAPKSEPPPMMAATPAEPLTTPSQELALEADPLTSAPHLGYEVGAEAADQEALLLPKSTGGLEAAANRLAELEGIYVADGWKAIAAIAKPLGVTKHPDGWDSSLLEILKAEFGPEVAAQVEAEQQQ